MGTIRFMQNYAAVKDSDLEKRIFGRRITVSIAIVALVFLALAARYAELQLLNYQTFVTQSENNRVHVQAVAPNRGLIFDNNGRLLAANQPSYNLVVVKERVDNLEQVLLDLQQLFDIDAKSIAKFKRRLTRGTPYQAVPLKFKLTEDEISRFAVNRYRLAGIEIKAQLVRHYPQGENFTHVLGYVGRINAADQAEISSLENNKSNYAATDYIGKLGIERFYESTLHGQVGSQQVETNAHGKVLRVLGQTKPQPGVDLHLYLDADLQQRISTLMGDRRGSVVAIDPRTGGILAMVSTPSYDPNPFVTGISTIDYAKLRNSIDLPLFNRSLQGQYPPGSTIKPIIGLAGLHYQVITADSTVSDPGWYQLPNDDRFYRDWKREGHGHKVNLHDSIAESCDVFFYDLAYQLGVDKIHDFSSLFGLGVRSGIDSTSERSGLLPSRQWKKAKKREPWFPGETLNIGIGQGYMLATPVQLAVATATIANRGYRPIPKLVKAFDDNPFNRNPFERNSLAESDLENSAQHDETSNNRPIDSILHLSRDVSDAHWQQIIDGMEAVVHDPKKGTARAIRRGLNYRIAGKTGTAQVVGIAQGEEYDADALLERQRDHALFVGFAPLEQPKVAVAVIVENAGGGSTVAAPIARKVFDWVLESADEKNQMAAVSRY